MSAKHEYRVCWRRQGGGMVTRIFQTEAAAYRKADGVLGLEAIKHATKRFEEMPDLIAPPRVQVREVGEWQDAERQLTESSDEARAGMEEWAEPSQSGFAYADADPF